MRWCWIFGRGGEGDGDGVGVEGAGGGGSAADFGVGGEVERGRGRGGGSFTDFVRLRRGRTVGPRVRREGGREGGCCIRMMSDRCRKGVLEKAKAPLEFEY